MIKKCFSTYLVIAIAIVSFKASGQTAPPSLARQHHSVIQLLVTGSYLEFENREFLKPKMDSLKTIDISVDSTMLSYAAQGALTDLVNSYGKINKARNAILMFEQFYYGNYTEMKSSDRLSTAEIVRTIDHLVWVSDYFKLLKSRKYLSKMLRSPEIEDLEILSLKNTALIQRLSLEVNNIYKANIGSAEKMHTLFYGVDMKNVVRSDQAVDTLNYLIPRLQYLEAEAKACKSLF